MNNRVCAAIDAIKAIDEAYWIQTLNQRLPSGAGSIVDGFETAEELETALRQAKWEEYSHESLMDGTVAFVSNDITGRLGVIGLETLPSDALVTLDDRKNTGKVSAVVQGILGDQVDYIVIILGQESGKEVVFTFHPGAPVSPSKVSAEAGLHGKTVTAQEALNMGILTVKIVA
jgi:hypothetical protein